MRRVFISLYTREVIDGELNILADSLIVLNNERQVCQGFQVHFWLIHFEVVSLTVILSTVFSLKETFYLILKTFSGLAYLIF